MNIAFLFFWHVLLFLPFSLVKAQLHALFPIEMRQPLHKPVQGTVNYQKACFGKPAIFFREEGTLFPSNFQKGIWLSDPQASNLVEKSFPGIAPVVDGAGKENICQAWEDFHFSIHLPAKKDREEKAGFLYSLEDASVEWNFVNEQHSPSYAGLPPEAYISGITVFSGGSASPKPPLAVPMLVRGSFSGPWGSLVGYYFLAGIILVYTGLRFFRNRNENQQELQIDRGHSIELEASGEGSCFQISLPMGQVKNSNIREAGVPEKVIMPFTRQSFAIREQFLSISGKTTASSRPRILLIESQQELAQFLSDYLSVQFQVHCAYNGREGCHQAMHQVPDLVVTDLLLPKMDGLSLIRQLKTHKLTSHIPLVTLSACSTKEERLQALESGADAYLSKPFSVEELALILKNLLKLRNNITEKCHPGEENFGCEGLEESMFLEKLTQIAEAHISDDHFGVNELLREIGMSRTQLYRKIKASTGHSANEFLREIKLEKGLLLLQTTRLPVAEVAERVGFGSASHFTKIFVEYFGILPSAVKNKS